MKKILSIILCLSVMLSISLEMVFADENTITNEAGFAGGSGTEEDPYQVATPEHLNNVRNYLNAFFVQISDIDMTEATTEGGVYYNNGNGWKPIGNSSKNFTGNYDGAEYLITGLNCKAEYSGLFGYNNGGIIKNINLKGTIIGKNNYTGGIVGYNYKNGVIKNCRFDGNITFDGTGTSPSVGGIVGTNLGMVTECSNYGEINATKGYRVGGVIGSNSSESSITKCFNYGSILGNEFVGGIVGESKKALISSCGNAGAIYSTTKSDTKAGFGGIAGETDSNISKCFNIGNITSTVTRKTERNSPCGIGVGGIAGFVTNGITISDCYNTGVVSSLYTCGDIVGTGSALKGWTTITTGKTYETIPESSVLTIKNCYSSTNGSLNNLYGYNASGYSWSGGYQANSCSYSNIITVTALNSYNVNEDSDGNVTQLTENEMKQKDKYIGFDFETVWNIDSDINNGMPYLRNISTSKIVININSAYFAEFETIGRINGVIAVALYDNENRMLEIKMYSPEEGIPVTLDKINMGKYMKVMWWNSITDMKPICKSKTIYVQ